MKKFLLLVAPLFLASLLHAQYSQPAPGSYLTVTFALKATEGVKPAIKETSTSYTATFSVKEVALNNTFILERLRMKGVLGAETSIKNWKIVAVYDDEADIVGFYALKTQKGGDIAIKINSYIYFRPPPSTPSPEPDGYIPAMKGKYSETKNGASVSISAKGLRDFYLDGFRTFTFTTKGVASSECFLIGLSEDSYKSAKTKKGEYVLQASSIRMTLYGQDDGWNFLEGKVTFGSPVILDDIYSVFPR